MTEGTFSGALRAISRDEPEAWHILFISGGLVPTVALRPTAAVLSLAFTAVLSFSLALALAVLALAVAALVLSLALALVALLLIGTRLPEHSGGDRYYEALVAAAVAKEHRIASPTVARAATVTPPFSEKQLETWNDDMWAAVEGPKDDMNL